MSGENGDEILYRENVRPPLWLIAFIFFLLASLSLSIWAAFDNPAGQISLSLSVLAVALMASKVALNIEIGAEELRAGNAHIEIKYLGQVTELDVEQMRLLRGRDADPAAFLAIRFWQPRGIKIEICDPRDPTPYWLISSKHVTKLAQALQKN